MRWRNIRLVGLLLRGSRGALGLLLEPILGGSEGVHFDMLWWGV